MSIHWNVAVTPAEKMASRSKYQEARDQLEREGLAKSMGEPGSGRTRGDGGADDVPPAVADDEKHVKDSGTRRWAP